MKIELEGYNLDEFIKTLYRKKITVQNLTKQDSKHLSFEIYDGDYGKVKKYIKNFKVKNGLSHLKMLPKFFVANLGLVLGVFLGIIFAIFASNFTWQINVYGTEDIDKSEVVQVLKDNGVSVGKINLETREDIEAILLNNYDRIAQVSVIKQGTAIIINISEKLVYNNAEQLPITAKYAGIVTEINILSGTSNVKVGDYVNIGDILVLPFNLDNNGNKINVTPRAEIKAQMYITNTIQLQKEEMVAVRTGKTLTCYNYKMYGKKLFSGRKKNSFALFDCIVYNECITDLVPLYREVEVYHELELTKVEHNFEQEKEALKERCYQEALQKLPNNFSLQTDETKTTIVDDTMYANTIICIQGIIND